jgi:hypothetical protein
MKQSGWVECNEFLWRNVRTLAGGFVFATLLDRPLVPPIMAALWYSGKLPGSLALLFAVQELVSFSWTLLTWRAELRKYRLS